MSKHKSIERHKAREFAMQAIYQWQYTQDSPTEIELQFRADNDMTTADTDYFSELLHKIPKHLIQIDEYIEKVIDRPFHELNPVELAILRIAIYEFIYRHDVPYKVVINEALQVTKTFGATEAFKYVNGVLDTLAAELRPLEVTLHRSKGPAAPKKKAE
ncbi:MAG: transcription antitermination factor NusB [Gammaproteobacteria bacterium]|nr:transcription antitermination factor NusB [Gammaproteobacteria bacterium]